jgi:formylglycine-generating enzyme required for sulfatase activity/class 3 adenylate cyclase
VSNEHTGGQVYPFRGGKDGNPPEGAPRRLAAIMAGDIAGYSRLMGMDEEGTHARVKRHRRELIEPTISEQHGRLVKYTGDGFLAMFDSPVEAVRCAIIIQQSLVGRNASLPREQWILYRIGVHLGDVIVERDDIYGDGVNIAARLEGIANPGDVFVSGGVYEQIKHKLVCAYQALGDRQVKNITDPVSVYRVLPDPYALMTARRGRKRLIVVTLGVLMIAALGSAFGFYLWIRHQMLAYQPPPAIEAPKTALTTPTQSSALPPTSPTLPPSVSAPPAADASSAPRSQATAPNPPVAVPNSPTTARAVPSTVPNAPTAALALPAMVALPGGTFAMGSTDDPSERPVHRVTVKPFALSKFPITNRQWRECVAAKACEYVPDGNDDAAVANVSWNDAQQFVEWLSKVTQKTYRLPSEAEWEYAARGGTQTKYWWGDQFKFDMANCKGCATAYDSSQPAKVGSFKSNPFALHDMGGNVDQWVDDCWHRDYQGAPIDGSAWIDKNCASHVIRSGSWKNDTNYVRPASRDHYDTGVRYPTHGLRVASPP